MSCKIYLNIDYSIQFLYYSVFFFMYVTIVTSIISIIYNGPDNPREGRE